MISRTRYAVLATAVVCALLGGLPCYALQEEVSKGDVVITLDTTNIRKGMTTLATVAAQTPLFVTTRKDDTWIGVSAEVDGTSVAGWVRSDRVSRLDDSDAAIAYTNRGTVCLNRNDFDRAIADLTEAIRLDETCVFAHERRGEAYRMKGEYAKAIGDCSTALRIGERSAYALGTRGSAHFAANEFDAAIADLTEAIGLDAGYAFAYEFRGDAHRMKGEYAKAIADCDVALRLNPRSWYAHAVRGGAHLGADEFNEAIADLTEVIALNNELTFAYEQRAKAFVAAGELARAEADFAKFFSLEQRLQQSSDRPMMIRRGATNMPSGDAGTLGTQTILSSQGVAKRHMTGPQ